MQTAFLGQAYQSRSPALASQTCINIYLEKTETTGSDPGGFFGTPGRTKLFQGIGEVRGVWNAEGTNFAVIGNTVYRFDSSFNATSLGTLPNSTGQVSMADNGTQLAIAHQDGWHWVALTGTAIAPVVGAPLGSIIDQQDQYVVFAEEIGGEWGLTALGDLSTIDPLQVATAESQPDNLISVLSLHREIWLFGDETIEIWDDTGGAFFPFSPASGGMIEQGCAAKRSIAKIDNSAFWWGRDRNGRAVCYRANSYVPVRISTHAIEERVQAYSTISDAISYSYQEEGHPFYVTTFPSGDETWVYDVSTGAWHQRASYDINGQPHRDRAVCHASSAGKHLVGDYENGMLYQSANSITTDNGTPVYRERGWESATEEHKKFRLDSLELIAQMGDGNGSGGAPIVWLQVSQDSGQTWGYERQRTLGPIGKRKTRAKWRRLGAGRDTALRICTTMTQKVCWIAAIAQGEGYAT